MSHSKGISLLVALACSHFQITQMEATLFFFPVQNSIIVIFTGFFALFRYWLCFTRNSAHIVVGCEEM